MKRKISSIPLSPPSAAKKVKLLPVPASKTFNYLCRDSCVDFIKFRHEKDTLRNLITTVENKKKEDDSFASFIRQRGIDFEKKIIEFLRKSHPVEKVSERYTPEGVERTLSLMKKGLPILYQAPVCNDSLGVYGVCDLLIRGDYLNTVFSSFKEQLPDFKAKDSAKNLGLWHYEVIDIKFMTLPLRADGIHLLNSGSIFAYKGQLKTYLNCLSKMQGYESSLAFIMGRGYTYVKEGQRFHAGRADVRLGVIDYENIDYDVEKENNLAIDWIRRLESEGHSWTLSPPSCVELYPNMSRKSGFDKEKKLIADDIGEITSIWYVGTKQREIAFREGVRSWRDDRLTSSLMKFKGERGSTIQKMLDINRQEKDLIRPLKIEKYSQSLSFLRGRKLLFTDFETINNIFEDFDQIPSIGGSNMIFLIGISWISQENEQKYKSFMIKEMTESEERRIIQEFVDFVKSFGDDVSLVHYTQAEETFFYNSLDKLHLSYRCMKEKWFDLSKIFKGEPIVLKGAFNYSLKTIAKVMHSHGFITELWDTEVNNGLNASLGAYRVYKMNLKNPEEESIMKDIERYNKYDCLVLMQIYEFLESSLS